MPTVEAPPEARCLDCDYSLHGLPSNRCPECGRQFDPQDHWTMNVGRPHGAFVKFLLSPVGIPTRAAAMLTTGALLWWAVALPKSAEALAAGLLGWAIIYVYRVLRCVTRRLLAHVYRRRLPNKRSFVFLILIVFSGTILWTRWPLRVVFAMHRPAFDRLAWHYYAEVPMIAPPPPPAHVGIYFLRAINASPSGVTIELDHARTLYYSPAAPNRLSWYYSWHPLAVELPGSWTYYCDQEAEVLIVGYPLVHYYYRVRYRLGI